MNTIEKSPITPIDADVVIVLTNKHMNRLEVHSLWESELSQKSLRIYALKLAQRFNEACGGGYVEIQIHDFRVPDSLQEYTEATPSS